ncbi:MAG: dihydrofolate reductase family protein [Myxococcales bacterium]
MAKLTMTSFVTLDGVMQAPGGRQEDTSGGFTHGGWVAPFVDEKFGAFVGQVFARADAFLLGRGTYQIFAGWWPKVTDPGDPIAAALNRLPKHVASRTLESVEWSGSVLLREVAQEVPRLKQRYGRELQVHGSPGLAQTLLQEDLLDELNLLVFPVALGGRGKRLFGSGTVPTAFELIGSQVTGKGVVVSTYRRAGLPSYGTIGG